MMHKYDFYSFDSHLSIWWYSSLITFIMTRYGRLLLQPWLVSASTCRTYSGLSLDIECYGPPSPAGPHSSNPIPIPPYPHPSSSLPVTPQCPADSLSLTHPVHHSQPGGPVQEGGRFHRDRGQRDGSEDEGNRRDPEEGRGLRYDGKLSKRFIYSPCYLCTISVMYTFCVHYSATLRYPSYIDLWCVLSIYMFQHSFDLSVCVVHIVVVYIFTCCYPRLHYQHHLNPNPSTPPL